MDDSDLLVVCTLACSFLVAFFLIGIFSSNNIWEKRLIQSRVETKTKAYQCEEVAVKGWVANENKTT